MITIPVRFYTDEPDDPDAEGPPDGLDENDNTIRFVDDGSGENNRQLLLETYRSGIMSRRQAHRAVTASYADDVNTGAMIALAPANPEMLAVEGGLEVDDIHLTMVFLGDTNQLDPALEGKLLDLVDYWVEQDNTLYPHLTHIAHLGPDEDPNTSVVYEVGGPGIHLMNARLRQLLDKHGVEYSTRWAYRPHISIKYMPRKQAVEDFPVGELEHPIPVELTHARLAWGQRNYYFPFSDIGYSGPDSRVAAFGYNPYRCAAGTGLTAGRFTDSEGMTCHPQTSALSTPAIESRVNALLRRRLTTTGDRETVDEELSIAMDVLADRPENRPDKDPEKKGASAKISMIESLGHQLGTKKQIKISEKLEEEGDWDSIEPSTLDLEGLRREGKLIVAEDHVWSKPIGSVVWQGEPLREGYYINVARDDDEYLIVDGHHRVAMHTLLGTAEVPVKVMDHKFSEPIRYVSSVVDDPAALRTKYPTRFEPVHLHSTLAWGKDIAPAEDGRTETLKITGRLTADGWDGLIVQNPRSNNDFPHITLGLADGVMPSAGNKVIADNQDLIEPLDDEVRTTERNNRGSGHHPPLVPEDPEAPPARVANVEQPRCPAGSGITSGRFSNAQFVNCNPQTAQLSATGLDQREANLKEALAGDLSTARRKRLEEELTLVATERERRADPNQPEGDPAAGDPVGNPEDAPVDSGNDITFDVTPIDEGMGLAQFGMTEADFEGMLERASLEDLKAAIGDGTRLDAFLTEKTEARIAELEAGASLDEFRDRLTGELSDFEDLDGEMSPSQIKALLEEREFEEAYPGAWVDPAGNLVAWDGTSQWFDTVTDDIEGSNFLYDFDVSELVEEVEQDFETDFWRFQQPVYHATTEDHVEEIMAEGIEALNETRGLSNRGIGSAVFASTNSEGLDSYGGEVFEIDVAAMKADGYMPTVAQEPGFAEATARGSLADLLGVEGFHMDIESGLFPDTVVFGNRIPAKYLKPFSGDRVTEAFEAKTPTGPPPVREDGTLGYEHIEYVAEAYERAKKRPDWDPNSTTSTMSETRHSGDQVFAEVLRDKGFDGQTTMVSSEEFARHLEATDYPLMYRGSAESYMDQFEGGEIFGGLGVYGNGTYAAISSSRDPEESVVPGPHERSNKGYIPPGNPGDAHGTARTFASWYSDHTIGTPDEQLGVVHRYTWTEEPRIAKLEDLSNLRGGWDERNAMLEANRERLGEEEGTFVQHRFLDAGMQAALAGFDAIEASDGGVMVILNRSKIMIDGGFREVIEPEVEVEDQS